VPLEARGERAAAGDKEAEGRRVQVAEPVQRHAGADGENGGEEEGVLQVEEVCFQQSWTWENGRRGWREWNAHACGYENQIGECEK